MAMKKLKRALLLISALPIALVGCATPATVLKNPSTGQVARCGGDSSGFMMGGLIGYHVQKDNDRDCIASYEAQGFIKVQ